MKIGILTYHDGPNHGAYLQAYSTMRVLENDGHDVDIINYKNKKHKFKEGFLSFLNFRRPSHFSDFFIKKRTFRKAHKKLNLIPERITTNSIEINKLHFDLVVVGSDVVWNYKIFGFDPIYFGDLNATRIISYAASFGWVSESDTRPHKLELFVNENFDALSVRDENSKRIIREITESDASLVLDPTLIYNFSNEEKKYDLPNDIGKYILVYSYMRDEDVINYVKNYAQKYNLSTISVGYRQSWCDAVLMDVDPFEWLYLYKNADRVLTSTYHGTIFSIKYQKDFFYITNEKAKMRVKSLFNLLGIQANLDVSDGKLLEISPKYKDVFNSLDTNAEKSKKWLIENI